MIKTLTVEEMRAAVAEADRKASAEALEQLNALVGSDQWIHVKEELEKARTAFAHDALAKLQLDGLATVMKGVESVPSQVQRRIAG